MRYRVTATTLDLTCASLHVGAVVTSAPIRHEVIDTEANELFADCATAWQVEDRYTDFWNRIDPTLDIHQPFHTHRATEKVVVLNVEVIP